MNRRRCFHLQVGGANGMIVGMSWMAKRFAELAKSHKGTVEERQRIVQEELKSKPWERVS